MDRDNYRNTSFQYPKRFQQGTSYINDGYAPDMDTSKRSMRPIYSTDRNSEFTFYQGRRQSLDDDTSSRAKRPPDMIEVKPYKNGDRGDLSVSSSPRTSTSSSSDRGVQRVFADYSEKCSLVGVPYISGARNQVEKTIWIVLLVAAIGVMFYHLHMLFSSYFSYSKHTQISFSFNQLMFPAITFCNVNAMRMSQIENASLDMQKLLEDMTIANLHKTVKLYQPKFETRQNFYQPTQPGGSQSSQAGPSTLRSSNFFDNMPMNLTVESPRHSVQNYMKSAHADTWEGTCQQSTYGLVQRTFKDLWVAMDPLNRTTLGHQISDMLLQCSFAGGQCVMGNFTPVLSATYGNCYTIQNKQWFSRKNGPDSGLQLILFLQADEYIPAITTEQGIQLVIHEQGTLPFPDDEGISVAAGTQTVIGLRQVAINRLGDPYGPCRDPDAFRRTYNVRYTRNTCQKVCQQSMIQDACNCYDETAQQALSIMNLTNDIDPCRNETEMKCLTRVMWEFSGTDTACDCNSPCSESQFDKTISSRQWPSVAFAKVIRDMICQESPGDECERLRNTSDADLKEQFIKLNIYFEDLNFEQLAESADYELTQFLSDVGGTIGLYIGLSVLGIFELFHLVADLCHFCCCSKRRKVEQHKYG